MHVWPARLHFRRVAAACVTVCLLPVRYVWGCFISVRQGGGCTSLTPPCAIMPTMPTTKLDRSSSSASCSLQGPWRQMEVAAYSMFQQAHPGVQKRTAACTDVHCAICAQCFVCMAMRAISTSRLELEGPRQVPLRLMQPKCHCGSCSHTVGILIHHQSFQLQLMQRLGRMRSKVSHLEGKGCPCSIHAIMPLKC